MRNRFLVAVGAALVFGLLVADAQARPGGGRRGGPARAGGARPGNIRAGNTRPGGQFGQNLGQNLQMPGGKAQSLAGSGAIGNLNSGNFQNKVSQLKTNFSAANQPFTPAWYADHPGAWQYTHPHADAWAVATAGTAAAWLGLAALTGGTVYTAETTDDTADDTADDQTEDTADTAGDYLPLGVFAIAPKSEKDASALVQLAVNKQGELRGNYYDVLSGQTQPVAGTLDKQSQRATFKAVPAGNATFETNLASLTQSAGTVTLWFANGQAKQWALARFDDAQAK